jgi:Peptidase family M23
VRAWPWIIGGGVAVYALTRGRREKSASSSFSGPLAGRWVWPVPTWQGRKPTVSDGFGSARPGGIRHGGVDVMFARLPSDTLRVGTPNGAAHHVMPNGMVALAAADGVVWSASQTPRGFAVVIDHSPTAKVATFYTHLEKLLVTPTANAKAGQRVRAGQPIGIIGADPLDGEHLKHLHFEIWFGGPGSAIDPAPVMKAWDVVANPSALVARNAGLVYRAIGASGEPYPDWIRALKGKAGVYIIRETDSGEIVYVGSSAGRLYDTLTRHFQTWRRYKGFWKGQYAEGHDPGLTYDRDEVEVAIRLTTPSASLDEEMRLIARLKPRDNLIGQPEQADEVPF